MKNIYKYRPEQIEKMLKLCIFHEDKHGLQIQVEHTILELKELSEELLPEFETKGKADKIFKVLSEIFDVEFMLFQLKISLLKEKEQMDFFNKIVDNKLEREMIRWGLDNEKI